MQLQSNCTWLCIDQVVRIRCRDIDLCVPIRPPCSPAGCRHSERFDGFWWFIKPIRQPSDFPDITAYSLYFCKSRLTNGYRGRLGGMHPHKAHSLASSPQCWFRSHAAARNALYNNQLHSEKCAPSSLVFLHEKLQWNFTTPLISVSCSLLYGDMPSFVGQYAPESTNWCRHRTCTMFVQCSHSSAIQPSGISSFNYPDCRPDPSLTTNPHCLSLST